MKIAIDGLLGCGYREYAYYLSKRFKIIHLDMNLLYHGIAELLLQENIAIDESSVVPFLDKNTFYFRWSGTAFIPHVDGKPLPKRMFQLDVTTLVYQLHSMPNTHQKLVEIQQSLSKRDPVIVSGYNISSHVLPDADISFFFDASISTRLRRLYTEFRRQRVICSKDELLCAIQKWEEPHLAGMASIQEQAIVIHLEEGDQEKQRKTLDALVSKKTGITPIKDNFINDLTAYHDTLWIERYTGFNREQLQRYAQAEIILVSFGDYSYTPSRLRTYQFNEQLRSKGIRTEILSIAEHLSPDGCIGGDAKNISESQKLVIAGLIGGILSLNPNCLVYVQQIGIQSVGVFSALHLYMDRVILDYDDYNINAPIFPFLATKMPSIDGEPLTLSFMRSCKKIIFSSHALKRIFCRGYENKVEIIPTGVSTRLFNHSQYTSSKTSPGSKLQLIWLGDVWGKTIFRDLTEMIKSLCTLPKKKREKCTIHLYAFGKERNALQLWLMKYAAEYFEIIFHSPVHPDTVPSILAKIDIGLIPLGNDLDFYSCKSPTKMFEFMAMKCCVIGNNVGEVSRILEHKKTGLIATDFSDFGAQLEFLIDHPEKRNEITESAYTLCMKNYTQDVLGDKLYRIFRRLLRERAQVTI